MNNDINIEYVSGSKTINLGFTLYMRMDWNTVGVDTIYNTSTVNIKIYFGRKNVQYGIDAKALTFTMDVEDVSYSGRINPTLSLGEENNGEQEILVKELEYTIQHRDDGTKNVRMCAALENPQYYHIDYDSEPVDEEEYQSVCVRTDLTAIPQASAIENITRDVYIGAADESGLNNSMTVDIAPLEESYRHDVIISLGDFSETIYDVYNIATYKIPVEWLASMPTAVISRGLITLITYDTDGMEVGRISTYWRAHVMASYAAPAADGIELTHIGCTWNNISEYVQGVSKVQLDIINARSEYCADIVKYRIVCDEYVYTGEEPTFTTGTINVPGLIEYSGYIVDSRGFKTQIQGGTIRINAYSPPRFGDVTTERSETDGSILNEGSYMRSTVNYMIDGTDFIENAATTYIEYKKSTDTEYTRLNEGFLNGSAHISTVQFNIDTAYDIRYAVSDRFSTSYYNDILPVSHISLEFLKGGRGAAFGKEAELENVLDIGYKLYARLGLEPIPVYAGDVGVLEGVNLNNYTLFVALVNDSEVIYPVTAYRTFGTQKIKGTYADYSLTTEWVHTTSEGDKRPAWNYAHSSLYVIDAVIATDGASFSSMKVGKVTGLNPDCWRLENTSITRMYALV